MKRSSLLCGFVFAATTFAQSFAPSFGSDSPIYVGEGRDTVVRYLEKPSPVETELFTEWQRGRVGEPLPRFIGVKPSMHPIGLTVPSGSFSMGGLYNAAFITPNFPGAGAPVAGELISIWLGIDITQPYVMVTANGTAQTIYYAAYGQRQINFALSKSVKPVNDVVTFQVLLGNVVGGVFNATMASYPIGLSLNQNGPGLYGCDKTNPWIQANGTSTIVGACSTSFNKTVPKGAVLVMYGNGFCPTTQNTCPAEASLNGLPIPVYYSGLVGGTSASPNETQWQLNIQLPAYAIGQNYLGLKIGGINMPSVPLTIQ